MYNNNNGANQNGRSSKYSGGNNGYNSASAPSRAMTLPENYVDEAERIMQIITQNNNSITTSKIRRIYNLICEIYNTENLRCDSQLAPESKTALNMARVRIAYEAGRDAKVKDFIDKTHIIEYIKSINSRENFINFARYMEALIAYHKFYGGKEN